MGSSRCFSLVGVYRGMLRFGALGLVLIISPFFELGIEHRFFSWIPHSSRNILSNFQNCLQPIRPVGILFSQFSRFSLCRTLIFCNYFDHISLFRTRNCVPFFLWIPHSSRNILSNFQNFLQPVRPVGIRFSRFIESTGVRH